MATVGVKGLTLLISVGGWQEMPRMVADPMPSCLDEVL